MCRSLAPRESMFALWGCTLSDSSPRRKVRALLLASKNEDLKPKELGTSISRYLPSRRGVQVARDASARYGREAQLTEALAQAQEEARSARAEAARSAALAKESKRVELEAQKRSHAAAVQKSGELPQPMTGSCNRLQNSTSTG